MWKNLSVKCIRISTLNLIMLGLSLIFFAGVLYTTFQIWQEYNEFIKITGSYVNWERAAHQMHIGSDTLTEQSRLYTQTREKKFLDNYFDEIKKAQNHQSTSEFLIKNNLHPIKSNNFQQVALLSNALAATEIYAMRLAAEGAGEDISKLPGRLRSVRLTSQDKALTPNDKIQRAREMLFDKEYRERKANILRLLNEVIDRNLSQTRTQQLNQSAILEEVLKEQRILLFGLCILNILTFAMIILLIIKPLRHFLKSIKDNKQLAVIGGQELRCLAQTYNDIFIIKEKHDRMLKYRAEHDALTGLMNRSIFNSLSKILDDEKEPTALLLVDVDKFKNINDTYGHEIGDQALKRVANLLTHSFRSEDLCIRMGGDEFAVVLRGEAPITEQRISSKVAYINKQLQNPEGDFPQLSISVGVAFSSSGFTDSLYSHADQALYEVKNAGRCGCKFYKQSDKGFSGE